MLVAGIDLGTKVGFIVADVHQDPIVFRRKGVYTLRTDNRWVGFATLLEETLMDVDAIFYEDVPAAVHRGAGAARIHGGLRATLELTAADHGIPLKGVSIQAAKVALTGLPRASKFLMRKAALQRYGIRDTESSGDLADALGVLLAGCRISTTSKT